jgi:hypothetical protein
VGLLEVHRARWRERCEQLGVSHSLGAFVFSPVPDGAAPYLPRAITQRFRRLALRLKLRSTRLHSLRHYSATELVAAGVDIRTVAGRLGHGSGGATTLKVYAAWVDEADRRAATTMATVLPRPVPQPARRRSPYEDITQALRTMIRTGELKPLGPPRAAPTLERLTPAGCTTWSASSTLPCPRPGRTAPASPLAMSRRRALDQGRWTRGPVVETAVSSRLGSWTRTR